jgi:hypothetical protein
MNREWSRAAYLGCWEEPALQRGMMRWKKSETYDRGKTTARVPRKRGHIGPIVYFRMGVVSSHMLRTAYLAADISHVCDRSGKR